MAWGASDLSTREFVDMCDDLAMLCLAVNERQAVTDQPETTFTYNGGTKARPSASDLSGMPLFGSFAGTLKEVQTATLALISGIPKWTTTSTTTTAWTRSSIEADIGLGAFPDTPEITNGNDWERIREALDRLIYARPSIPHSSYGVQYRSYGLGGDVETNWDGAKAASTSTKNEGTIPIGPFFVSWEGFSFRATIYDDLAVVYPTSNYNSWGTLTHVGAMTWSRAASQLLNGWSVDVAGTTVTFPSGSTSNQTGSFTPSGVSLAANYTLNISVNTSEPADCPFDITPFVGGFCQIGFPSAVTQSLVVVIDVSSSLTDQA